MPRHLPSQKRAAVPPKAHVALNADQPEDLAAETKVPKAAKSAKPPKPKPVPRPAQKKPRAHKKPAPRNNLSRKLLALTVEMLGLATAAIFTIIGLLGYWAEKFSGTRFFSNLLPFAAGVLVLILATAGFLVGWWRLRRWLPGNTALIMPVLAATLALLLGGYAVQDNFALAYGHFRTLVGGKEEAGRATLSHQVYAAYRRYPAADLLKIMARSRVYTPAIEAAAKAYALDSDVLHGIAAAESSFLPRTSFDGGQGLFQITHIPKFILEDTARQLEIRSLNLQNPRHNTYAAAATFKHYLDEMNGDLYLALLAYNIGAANGGLRFIMKQYGATDFTSIQPYLQELPRGYPVRVLSYALAFRLWRTEGKLPAYEEGQNAIHIQHVGIPGLHEGF